MNISKKKVIVSIIFLILIFSIGRTIFLYVRKQYTPITVWPKGSMHIGEGAINIAFVPDTLSRRRQEGFFKVYIELPWGQDVRNIDASTVRLNGIVAPLDTPQESMTPSGIGDQDNDGRVDRMVAFDKSQVIELFIDRPSPGKYEIEVTGESENFLFKGTNYIRVIHE